MSVEEFLRYSMDHGRRIKAIFMVNNQLVQQNILILRYTDEDFTYTSAKQKAPHTLPMGSLLSVGYARGDTGETD
jgi:hypothetical protein